VIVADAGHEPRPPPPRASIHRRAARRGTHLPGLALPLLPPSRSKTPRGLPLAAAALEPALTGTDYLTGVADQPNRLAAAALLYLIAAGTSVGIAIALYPLLTKRSTAVALAAVVFRTIETVFYTAAVVSLLSILPLGRQLATAPADSRAPIRAIAGALLSMREHSTLAAVFAFSVAALMYYTLFHQARLVPRWLSGWGIAAALLTRSQTAKTISWTAVGRIRRV
jgi:hypothetical protein